VKIGANIQRKTRNLGRWIVEEEQLLKRVLPEFCNSATPAFVVHKE
jgi:hypothetical protein